MIIAKNEFILDMMVITAYIDLMELVHQQLNHYHMLYLSL